MYFILYFFSIYAILSDNKRFNYTRILIWKYQNCTRNMPQSNIQLALAHPGGGGGYSIYFLTGCVVRGLKPLPISMDFSPSKNGWFDAFFQNFRKLGPISKVSFCLKSSRFYNLFTILPKQDALLRIFLLKWVPCLRIFGEKLTPGN